MAGIIGGNGSCFGAGADPFDGVAPDVDFISLRALDSRGQGMDSWVISAINWAISKKNRFNIKVIYLSLGRSIQEGYADDPLCQAVERAWKAGIVVVVAAGNAGRDDTMDTDGYGTISSPGNDPYAITVGATRMVGHTGRSDDAVSSYSSKGPTMLDHIVKPDLVAPGNAMFARMSEDDYLVQSYQANKVGVYLAGNYIPNAYLLSGAAALMLAKDPSLTPDQVKARLMKTAWKSFTPTASVTDSTTGEAFNLQHDLFTVGAVYLDINAELASTETASKEYSALSPRVVFTNGEAVLETNHPALDGESILWGRDSVWDTAR